MRAFRLTGNTCRRVSGGSCGALTRRDWRGRNGDSNGSKAIREICLPLSPVRYTERSTAFLSSLTLPGQSCRNRADDALALNPANTGSDISLVMLIANAIASGSMSSVRSRNGGTVITSNASRSRRSSRKRPSATSVCRSAFVEPTIRTSTYIVSLPPTRWSSPYSMTRRIFSCIRRVIVASSSSTSVPPSARSK